ncbi:hypothetical protein DAPPUDRAFT_319350 [Daphnia pulex]|uniref:Uncharacterized protein n=1 Tax=Daphnia pulex TaxID=6669 RepID=E9GLG2_DAPPU|nr:hypothetical protein DAPPUDRAFT_319350 [Daphnia pulex]|eukprot:EFX79512.1 hypothetical protein DAPPUDRAFT_319350 [Daphnia pulex]
MWWLLVGPGWRFVSLLLFLTNFDAEDLETMLSSVNHVEKLSNILLLQWHLLIKGT